jgi:hypothetical protein
MKSMRLRHATTPIQDHLIEQINTTLIERGEEVPEDGYDRVEYRMDFVFACYDDESMDDPGQPVADLLTDIVHVCEAKGWDVHEFLQRALWMADQERQEWGER